MTDQPLISPPIIANDRGFYTYGGRPIPTDYGHTITVRESSAASGPHVWLAIDGQNASADTNPHLSLAQAIALREALGQFIDGVPDRWVNGAQKLAEATQAALGTATPEEPQP
ncbi:hypothetical protein [Kitasatospora sp. NPDC090091]|uniref:hypothetical protein n=1 Tax=Kitasatospora sp. NPDC090091 TaxID=3364081 RepID=UPI003824A03E